MGGLVDPRGKPRKEVLVLEAGKGVAAAITNKAHGDVIVVTPKQELVLEAGNWMIVDGDRWTQMLVIAMQAQDLITASNKAGRRARKRINRDGPAN